ncbi:uncharacterized protein LOC144454567 [Phascolarctos cinereus]
MMIMGMIKMYFLLTESQKSFASVEFTVFRRKDVIRIGMLNSRYLFCWTSDKIPMIIGRRLSTSCGTHGEMDGCCYWNASSKFLKICDFNHLVGNRLIGPQSSVLTLLWVLWIK